MLVIVEVLLVSPSAKLTEVAERLKPGVATPVSAANRPEFGLPHPVTRSYPFTAEKLPDFPLVMSWKLAA